MAERSTAESQLARVLELLPRAARAGGVALDELARELEVAPAAVLRDLQEVYTREYYHPAGSADGVHVLIDADQVEVWTTGEFRRPPRFRPREALALGLGLRILAAEASEASRAECLALAERLEAGLSLDRADMLPNAIAVHAGFGASADIRATLDRGARTHRVCEIAYRKAGADDAETRLVDPYLLIAAHAKWYLVARCHRAEEVRVFRLDRITAAEARPDGFTMTDDFDPDRYLSDGRVFLATNEVEVPVRYSPRVARWVEEAGPVERELDGSVIVRYHVADPDWLVRHVLRYGADAEVLGPPEIRQRVHEALIRVAGSE